MEENNENLQVQEDVELFNQDNENLQNIDTNIKELLKLFENEKKDKKAQEEEKLKQEKIDEKKILEEEKENQKNLEKEKEKQEEFYNNIKTISENTGTEVTSQLLTDVSTLMQVNIITNGLLIGIVCITLFAKFFKN